MSDDNLLQMLHPSEAPEQSPSLWQNFPQLLIAWQTKFTANDQTWKLEKSDH